MNASRGRPAGDRKSLTLEERRKERRASSDRRKSGPKAADVSSSLLDGKADRRRLSANHRRTSRSNKAAALRRERGQPRPPLVGHRGIGRASLPARLPPQASAVAAPATAVAGKAHDDDDGGVVAMEEEKTEEKGDGVEGSWTPEKVAEAAKAILSDDRQLQLRSLRWLRVVLSLSETPPAEEVVQAGLLPRLVEFLRQTDCPELRPEALCALTNIASTKHTKAVATEPSTLPTLVALLASSDLYLREQSAWCLGNIAADGLETRDLVLSAGVLEPLLATLSPSQDASTKTPTSLMRTGTWALNNLCRRLPPPPMSVVLPIISTLRPVIEAANTTDAEILTDAGWALYHITRGGSDRIDAVRSAGMLSMMPDMVLHDDTQCVRPVIRAMENLACSSAAHRGALIEAGVLDPLVETLGSHSPKVRADALRLLSCIAAGSPDQVTAVASTPDVIPSVMAELEEGNATCRREAAWVFLNMCECGRDPQASIMPGIVGNGGISAVCQNLDMDSDAESLLVMLSLLFTILDEAAGAGPNNTELAEYVNLVEEAEGFDKIIALANDHDDMEIYDKAMDIISSFNPGDHDNDDNDGSVSETALPRTPDRAAGRNDNDNDDDDDNDMSDDSLSDDSFHREHAGGAGPITPPQQHRPPPPPDTPATPPGSLPRMPLGAVGGNGAGGEESGEFQIDRNAAVGAPRTGVPGVGGGAGPGEQKTVFRESEGDKTE